MRVSALPVVLLVLLVAPLVSGCATVFNGTNQDVTVESSPPGADVYDDGRLVGRTPTTLDLERRQSHLLTLEMDGYEESEVLLSKEVDPLPLVADLFFWPSILFDLANGSAYTLDPNYVYVEMQPLAGVEDERGRPLAAVRAPSTYTLNGPRRQSGPRFGVTYLAPGVVDKINEVLDDGSGEDVINTPLITQFGWQFETQTFQAESGLTGVVEFVPLIGGLERGRFFPTFTLIAGARTPTGFEIGVGPNISLTGLGGIESSSNETGIAAGLAIAAGKSIDVGGANVPINGAIVLGESGARFSLLIGLTTSTRRY